MRLRIPEQDDEYPLAEGVHGLARDAAGLHVGVPETDAIAWLCLDRRGAWLTLPEGATGVHVNGRRVRRMAMLRAGDSIYLDGAELVLAGEPAPVPEAQELDAANEEKGDSRVVLRGVGGKHHGRSFTLERPRLVGRAGEADIRVDDPGFAERHAQVMLVDGRILLRDLGSGDGSLLNGNPVNDAWLQSGDQLAFDPQHRYVVEAPGRALEQITEDFVDEADALSSESRPTPPSTWRRWPWLLLSALLIAGVLAALLTWGSTS